VIRATESGIRDKKSGTEALASEKIGGGAVEKTLLEEVSLRREGKSRKKVPEKNEESMKRRAEPRKRSSRDLM